MTDLETRLRAELNAAAQDVRVSPDAWQRNQRLLAGNHVGRRVRLTWLATAAAVVVTVVAGFTALSGNGNNRPAPPAETDPFPTTVIGKPVEVARLGSGPNQLRVVMAITEGKGGRPDMCTRFITSSGSSNSCGGQSDDPATAPVAFDYLSGSKGGLPISVEGAVDTRVASVRAWLNDGTEVRPRLVSLGAEELRGFAVPTAKDHPYAVRLAAYTSDGKALEYVNLATRFGADWFPAENAPVSGCPADLDCRLENLDPGLIADVIREPDRVIVLVWPEVSEFEVSAPTAVNRNGFSVDEPGALVRALVITPATFGDPMDAQVTLTAHAGANSVEMKSPPP